MSLHQVEMVGCAVGPVNKKNIYSHIEKMAEFKLTIYKYKL